tara:strand:- start:43 stop:375 length:333 start_codon:yes stop_codon:yes gene_type:complete
VVLAGRVPGVGRVGVGGEVVDVVVAAGAPVVVVAAVDAAVVVVATCSDVDEVEVDAAVAAVVAGAAVVTGEAASEPPPHAEPSTAMVRKAAIARIGRVCHNAGCAAGVMA